RVAQAGPAARGTGAGAGPIRPGPIDLGPIRLDPTCLGTAGARFAGTKRTGPASRIRLGPTCLGTSGAGFAGARGSGPAGRTPVRQPGPAGVLLPAHLPGGPPELALQVPGDVPDLGPDLRRHAAHRVPDLALQLGQLPAAAGQLVPAGRGGRVDLAAALLAVGGPAPGLPPGPPRGERAPAGARPAAGRG